MHELRMEQHFPLKYDFVHPGYNHYTKLTSTFVFTQGKKDIFISGKQKPQWNENLKEIYDRYCYNIYSKLDKISERDNNIQ